MDDSGNAARPDHAGPSGTAGPDSTDRNWAMAGHLAGLAGYIIPLGNVIGPLVIWLTQRDTYPFAGQEALKALNFNITVLIAYAAAIVVAILTCGIGGVLLLVIGIVHLIFCILAAVAVSRGEPFVYPVTLDLVR